MSKVKKEKFRFLETITVTGGDAIVPINRIKYINFGYYENGYAIRITTDDGNYEENFGQNIKEAQLRYSIIQEIINSSRDIYK